MVPNSDKKSSIIFLGTPEFALPALGALIKNNFKLVLVITQPDQLVGRKQLLTFPPVKQFAMENNLTVAQPRNKKELVEIFSKLEADACILVAYGQIIPEEILDKPRCGFLNIHPSLLPKYRGSSPIQTAILNGEKKTGVSIIQLVSRVDAGPIFGQSEIEILPTDNTQILSQKLARAGAELLIKILPDYLAGKIKPQIQAEESATFTKIIERPDGRINWLNQAQQIDSQFRAFYPWPGVFTHLAGKRLKIVNLSVLGGNFQANLGPGQVFLGPKGELAVQCGQGAIRLEKVQLEGKKELSGREFLKGCKDLIGQALK
jgi:methionyl-tRNA formyltransferase